MPTESSLRLSVIIRFFLKIIIMNFTLFLYFLRSHFSVFIYVRSNETRPSTGATTRDARGALHVAAGLFSSSTDSRMHTRRHENA